MKVIKKIFIVLIILMAVSCATMKANDLVTESFHSQSLVENNVGEKPNKKYSVYLPPGYHQKWWKKYPVIYFLHGFGDSRGRATGQKTLLDQAILNGSLDSFIIVEPSGNSRLGGSFYYNSPVTGNWEDYIVNDLIKDVESKYRAISKREARGISGFSMGGTGAINIAFKYPDIFGAVCAYSPGILKNNDIDTLLKSWNNIMGYKNSYGAAISPNPDIEFPYAEIPYMTYEDEEENKRVINNWYGLFGNQQNKIEKYLQKDNSLLGIRLEVSSNENYKWIINGSEDFHSILESKNIEHQYIINDVGHSVPQKFVIERLLPFFSESLIY